MKKYKLALATISLILSTNVSAVVITDTNFTLNGSTLTAYRGITDCCTSMFFNKADKFGLYNYLGGGSYYGNYSTITHTNSTVDVTADYFLVKDGAEFTATTIATGQFQRFATNGIDFSNTSSIDVPFGDFYLGIALDRSFDNVFTEFGWMQLSNSSVGLQMIGSAMAYGESGIIIGSSAAVSSVPVPAAAWLFLSGILGLAGFVKHKKA